MVLSREDIDHILKDMTDGKLPEYVAIVNLVTSHEAMRRIITETLCQDPCLIEGSDDTGNRH